MGGNCNVASGCYSGVSGCCLTASSNCTFYVNNLCSCNTVFVTQCSFVDGYIPSYARACFALPANFTAPYCGNVYGANVNRYEPAYCGATFQNSNVAATNVSLNILCFNAANCVTYLTQAGGANNIRALSNFTGMHQLGGTNNGVITHVAGMQSLGWYIPSSVTNCICVCNNYGMLINDQNGYSTCCQVCIGNRWGVYQEGCCDINFFCAPIIAKSIPANCAVCVNAGGCMVGYGGGSGGSGVEILDSGFCSTVRCGVNNCASGDYSAALGGLCNVISNTVTCLAVGAVVVGGVGNNTCSGGYWSIHSCTFAFPPTICNAGAMSFVGAGFQNIASGTCSFVGSGCKNIAGDHAAAVVAGYANTASGCYSFIGGGAHNCTDWAGFVGGGGYNTASVYGAVGGGDYNKAGCSSFIGGGFENCACGLFATIGGGSMNTASACYSFIGGGGNNIICNSACFSGAVGCGLIASCACTFYVNNLCSCTNIYSSHYISQSTTPILSKVGASSASIASRSTDTSGSVTFVTSVAGSQIGIQFTHPFSIAPIVVLTPNASFYDYGVYVVSSMTGFNILWRGTPSGGSSGSYNYIVIG